MFKIGFNLWILACGGSVYGFYNTKDGKKNYCKRDPEDNPVCFVKVSVKIFYPFHIVILPATIYGVNSRDFLLQFLEYFNKFLY